MGRTALLLGFLIACGAADEPAPPASTTGSVDTAESPTSLPTDTAHSGLDLPHHDECLPVGEEMTDATCLAVVAHDGRYPGQSFDKSGVDPGPDDPRVGSDDLAWITAEIRRCTCSCCHQSTLGGPGSYFWDLDYDGVWLDSASDWSLRVLAGIQESENQRLPTDDPERLQRIVEDEISRRGR